MYIDTGRLTQRKKHTIKIESQEKIDKQTNTKGKKSLVRGKQKTKKS